MLFATAAAVPEDVVEMKTSGGELRTKQVTGTHSSMTVATRTSGYHSQPHFHDCEQINYVTAGSIWVFIQDRAFHLRRGDFLRIPPSAMHWAWNRSEENVELIELHTPGLLLDGVSPVALVEDSEMPGTPVPSGWGSTDLWAGEQAAIAAMEAQR
jgi:mannose-6-phosphate isomerase-like protein (cupin superfamily)